MKPAHREQFRLWLTVKLDAKPDLFKRAYASIGLTLSQYVWDLIYSLNESQWIKETLYPYLDDEAIEATAVQIIKEWAL